MIDFAPGMRTIIRDEEWMVKKIETNSLGNKTQTVKEPLLSHGKIEVLFLHDVVFAYSQ